MVDSVVQTLVTVTEATVVSIRHIGTHIRLFQLLPDQILPYRPGQYAEFLIGDSVRPLSIASYKPPLLEFIVNVAPGGIASTFVTQLQHEDRVRLRAPYGRFVINEAASQSLLYVATGTGVAPIRSHLQWWQTQTGMPATTLLLGNYNQALDVFAEELQTLQATLPHFMYVPVYSQPDESWQGERGLVTDVLKKLLPDLVEPSVYLCGNPYMVRDSVNILLSRSGSDLSIHVEQFN